MGILTYIILLAVTGLVVGGLARLALPGKDPMTIPQTMLLGIVGSTIAGFAAYAISGGTSGGGIVLAVAVSTLLVYLVRRRRGGTLTKPGLGSAQR